ncbi:carboxypeptidase-like regulatory domain-containing protein [Marivirga sp.]|uniref:carboxypeptidase-like regulatory domain-containing protein n=1 Tax=Marivirga sp. TaxID=2018662 RepID=UPI002D7F8E42|nr:carboxypeptidase-like regulatory domain-containing protein [Marivirga sp.]HET8860505.1 carboxypeptidase-like regulatory domain-containing protein [Marivirga sp.]
MNINLTQRCLFLLFTLSSLSLNAQNIIGKIIDKEQRPVPYAHIVLDGTTMGTISNDSGYFKLKIPENINRIKITSVSYKPQLIEKSSLGTDGINKITLENDRISLAEVEVSGTFDSARYFMEQVIKKLRKNYPSKNYSQLAFYREATVQDSTYKRAVEAIVLMSDREFRKNSNLTQYELIQIRKSKENRDQNFRNELSDWLYQDSGPYYINKKNPIKPMGGKNADLTEKILNPRLYKERKEMITRFLHKGMLEHCLFEITNKYKTENDELIEISIEPLTKPVFGKWLGAYGKFIISRNDMAVISHERFQYGKAGTFRNNSIRDSTRAYYYIEYKKRKEDGKYYTHYIKDMSMGTNTGGLLGTAKSSDFWNSKGEKGGIYSVNEWYVIETRDFEKINREDQMYLDEDIYYTEPTKRYNISFDDLNIIQLNPINQKIKKDLQSNEQNKELFINP